MTTMSDIDTLVTTDTQLHDELKQIWEEMGSSPGFTEYALRRGFTPPDDREGWSIAYAYGPNGEDLGLVWSEPSYPQE